MVASVPDCRTLAMCGKQYRRGNIRASTLTQPGFDSELGSLLTGFQDACSYCGLWPADEMTGYFHFTKGPMWSIIGRCTGITQLFRVLFLFLPSGVSSILSSMLCSISPLPRKHMLGIR